MITSLLAATTLSFAAAPTTYALQGGEIRFEIEAPLDTISGASRGVSGTITLDPANVATAPAARIDVSLASFTTGIALRDEDLRDQFLETAKFTKATLIVEALERPSAAALTTAPLEAIASGTLNLHGNQRPVKIPLKMYLDGDKVTVAGDFVLPILDYGMKRPTRLIFKLGTDVKVSVRGTFKALPPSGDKAAPVVAAPTTDPVPPQVVVALEPKQPPPPPKFQFAEDTAEGRGERNYNNTKIGGKKNVISCKSCHSLHDERKGLGAPNSKTIKPNASMWNAAKRSTLWQGIATTPGHAADICARLFMLREEGLDPKVKGDLDAYLKAISPDPQPALDYDVLHLTRSSPVPDAQKGNADNGKKLVGVYCVECHDKGRIRPPLEVGLYEADFIVRRVRRQPGSDNLQMPPITVDRLTDSDLRDIVTYLADEKQRIFKRAKR